MLKKIKKYAGAATVVVASSVVSVSAMAQDAGGVSSAASNFQTTFSGHAATIGGAMVAAAFAAVVWKWVKGMAFS
ncbi:hypothetical protein V6D52_00445 [Idiomarina loihiensis]|uniref:hypothetical protein n=1 Tax=Idiomarina loihiensis TaxID=135577 RepID=UPI003157FA30